MASNIIRVFDALNDLRNMEVAADQVKKREPIYSFPSVILFPPYIP